MMRNTTVRMSVLRILNTRSLRESRMEFLCACAMFLPPYHRLVSLSFLLIWFTVTSRMSEMTELNRPIAEE